ncbi:response regulator [Caulobacter sp. 602-2]|uniref:histidine kinase n=1 Tax=Caulobacter sp. 602-2 TaxID=2710887 RepID=A0A6G4QVK9_9CAUL|nr:response regulator [Caulobacter sp. 602-2]
MGDKGALSARAERRDQPAGVHLAGVRWGLLVALVCAYVGSFLFSDLLTRDSNGMPSLWPMNAILAAGLLRMDPLGRRLLLGVALVTNLAVHALAGDPWTVIAVYTACDMAESLAAAALTRRLRGPRPSIRSVRHALVLVAAMLPITVTIAALGSSVAAPAAGADLWPFFTAWAACNSMGMIIALPAALVILDPTNEEAFQRPLPIQAGLYALVAAATAFAFLKPSTPMPFLIFPAAMLAAFQLGPRGAAWSAVIVIAITAPMTVAGEGIARLAPRWAEIERIRMVQAFVTTIFFTCLAAALSLYKEQRLKGLMARRSAAARAARARAQAAGRARTDFLATMSHEIRTPLNSVLGFANLLAETEDGLSPAGRRKLELIAQAGGSLATIVDDILDFSRLEAGRVELRPEAVDPAALLADAASIIALDAQTKGLSLAVEADLPAGFDYALDPARLRQVLLNLLNNAVKFTAAGAVRASVRLETTYPGGPERLRFTVADTGIGIAPEVQGRLFQRFSQADGSISRAFGGAGLGLAISKTLVTRMGGEIGVDSAPGQGATFWFTTPAEPVCAADGPAPEQEAAARVLLVDDHPMNRELGAAMLILAGCAVETAEDGDEAVRAAAAGDFDIILMDIHMPRMDGLAAARAIKALPGAAGRAPIIALSADVMPQQIERCRQAGMVDHVAKPIQRDVLIATLNRWLGAETEAA